MIKQFPMDRVPNLQSIPENGYPIQAYYGVDASLEEQTNGASKDTNTAKSPTTSYRMIFIILAIVFGSYALFHWYMK